MITDISVSAKQCMVEMIHILNDINAMQNLERTLHNIVKALTSHLSCQTCAIIRLNPDTQELEIVNSHGLSWQFCKAYRKKIVSSVISDLIWKDTPVYIADQKDNLQLAGELKLEKEFRSCFGISLTANKKPLGYLYVDSDSADHFQADDQLMISFFSRIISLAMLKDNLQRELQNASVIDHETGTIHYNHFYGRLHESLSRAQRLNENLSLILLDVVKFDKILLSNGLETGRKLMRDLAQSVKNTIRKYDALSRFGTDELIISLAGHSRAEALDCAKKLYQKITSSSFTEHKIMIDVTIGLASFPENAKDINGLLTATKNALSEAKRKANVNIFESPVFYS
jgi:diguanylate cyclase (GGDEF)-like protein